MTFRPFLVLSALSLTLLGSTAAAASSSEARVPEQWGGITRSFDVRFAGEIVGHQTSEQPLGTECHSSGHSQTLDWVSEAVPDGKRPPYRLEVTKLGRFKSEHLWVKPMQRNFTRYTTTTSANWIMRDVYCPSWYATPIIRERQVPMPCGTWTDTGWIDVARTGKRHYLAWWPPRQECVSIPNKDPLTPSAIKIDFLKLFACAARKPRSCTRILSGAHTYTDTYVVPSSTNRNEPTTITDRITVTWSLKLKANGIVKR